MGCTMKKLQTNQQNFSSNNQSNAMIANTNNQVQFKQSYPIQKNINLEELDKNCIKSTKNATNAEEEILESKQQSTVSYIIPPSAVKKIKTQKNPDEQQKKKLEKYIKRVQNEPLRQSPLDPIQEKSSEYIQSNAIFPKIPNLSSRTSDIQKESKFSGQNNVSILARIKQLNKFPIIQEEKQNFQKESVEITDLIMQPLEQNVILELIKIQIPRIVVEI